MRQPMCSLLGAIPCDPSSLPGWGSGQGPLSDSGWTVDTRRFQLRGSAAQCTTVFTSRPRCSCSWSARTLPSFFFISLLWEEAVTSHGSDGIHIGLKPNDRVGFDVAD